MLGSNVEFQNSQQCLILFPPFYGDLNENRNIDGNDLHISFNSLLWITIQYNQICDNIAHNTDLSIFRAKETYRKWSHVHKYDYVNFQIGHNLNYLHMWNLFVFTNMPDVKEVINFRIFLLQEFGQLPMYICYDDSQCRPFSSRKCKLLGNPAFPCCSYPHIHCAVG